MRILKPINPISRNLSRQLLQSKKSGDFYGSSRWKLPSFAVHRLAAFAVLVSFALGSLSCGGGETEVANNNSTVDGTPTGECLADPKWFPHDQTAKANDSADFESNCQFHQWSWQSFLWLTQKMPNGELRFETFANPEFLTSTDGKAPPPYSDATGGSLKFMPRVAKSGKPSTIDEIHQADSNGLLIDQKGRSVYYSQYVNDVFYNFVVEKELYDPEKLAKTDPTLNFPVKPGTGKGTGGAMELKAAWKIVEEGEDTTGFYTRKAQVAKLLVDDGSVRVSKQESLNVTVALVGLHIAGVVKDHPEFIWATFEQKNNSPTLTDEQLKQYLDTKNNKINNQPVSDQNFTFYKAGTKFIDSNQNNNGVLDLVNPNGQKLTPKTDVFIQYAQGGGDEDNRNHIKELNTSVLEKLKDPVFGNFYLGGAIWLDPKFPLVPDSTLQDEKTGSTELSNGTMETFTQKDVSNNCFSCHNTKGRIKGTEFLPGLNVGVSHILVNNYFRSKEQMTKVSHKQAPRRISGYRYLKVSR